MSPRPVALHRDPVPAVIEALEQALEAARSGEIRSVAIVALGTGVRATTEWAGEYDAMRLVGAVDWLRHRLLADLEAEGELQGPAA